MNVARQLSCNRTNLFHKAHVSVRRVTVSIQKNNFTASSTSTSSSNKINVLYKRRQLLFSPSLKTVYARQNRFVSQTNPRTPFNVNKNVPENILIFSHENGTFYKFLTFFGVLQMLMWGYLSLSPVRNLRSGPVEVKKEDAVNMPWWKRWLFKEGQYKNAITGISLTVGTCILFVTLTYPRRAVKSLWLLKGGKSIRMVTHSQFKKSQAFNVPLNHVNCMQTRTGTASQIPLKIKDKAFFFLMDKQGTFHHPDMFDFHIGLQRKL